MTTAGSQYIHWPGICKELGLEPNKVCGPTLMEAGGFPEGSCCFNHPKGSPLHAAVVNGKPFKVREHWARLKRLGLITHKKELAALRLAGGKPPGTPTKIGQTLVYPVPHFA